ncbi:uncharacterized protein C8Q71DRAFT_754794, partial [Rhodofomes roseus]
GVHLLGPHLARLLACICTHLPCLSFASVPAVRSPAASARSILFCLSGSSVRMSIASGSVRFLMFLSCSTECIRAARSGVRSLSTGCLHYYTHP